MWRVIIFVFLSVVFRTNGQTTENDITSTTDVDITTETDSPPVIEPNYQLIADFHDGKIRLIPEPKTLEQLCANNRDKNSSRSVPFDSPGNTNCYVNAVIVDTKLSLRVDDIRHCVPEAFEVPTTPQPLPTTGLPATSSTNKAIYAATSISSPSSSSGAVLHWIFGLLLVGVLAFVAWRKRHYFKGKTYRVNEPASSPELSCFTDIEVKEK